ncbi:hypothetical protein ACTOB_002634 [Actinoplanes oblitus]|uniref:Lipoprotein n=1 Tax=Actinoplanes oblitus TaxID=3040509 RepID=A0ABY8WSF4_9ACTN|nr:hypothetical protein [Actinoplanes oblitus]WIN00780.1 hypothetical protein ACTOB_002634 [Actinoplanes oblitus]
MLRRVAASVTLLATAALAAGCEIELNPDSIPAPFSVAPVPSASAGQPKYVCTAVYKILTDGAVKAAGWATHKGDDAKAGLQKTFADMATQVTAAGAQSSDPAQRAAVDEVAAALTRGSQSEDPKAFLNGDFVTVGQKIDNTCP